MLDPVEGTAMDYMSVSRLSFIASDMAGNILVWDWVAGIYGVLSEYARYSLKPFRDLLTVLPERK